MRSNSSGSGCYGAIRQPKCDGGIGYNPYVVDNIIRGLVSLGFELKDFTIDLGDYQRYFVRAGYKEKYPNYYPSTLYEKSLEHYIAAKLLNLSSNDVYIDVASANSPAPEIYSRLFGCKTYRQDLAYPEGLNGDTIGGDAANMPVPDGFASKMALHCSFEHFEGDSDVRFIRECARVLRKGCAVCIVPLYLFDKYVILTDPKVSIPIGVQFEEDAIVFCRAGWGNRHGRFYDPAHLAQRVRANLSGMGLTIYRVTNAREIHETCYMEFVALITRP
jgi:SAM-dependent methyltransferase